MLDTRKNGIKKIFSILTSIWSIFVGVLFIVQVWRIFGMGDRPFTGESISNKFIEIAIPTYIWLALVVASLVIALVLPNEPKKITPFALSMRATVGRLQARLPQQTENSMEKTQQIYVWKVRSWVSWSVCAVLGGLCLCVAIAYLVGGFAPVSKQGFFADHTEAEFLLRALPWVFGALGAGIFGCYFHSFTQNKQIVLMKAIIAEEMKLGNTVAPVNVEGKKEIWAFTNSAWFLPVVRGVVGAVAIVLIVVGICNGGMADVFNKAVRICTQCIGLG